MQERHWLQPKSWSDGSYMSRFRFVEKYIRNKTVLDLGCASGYKRPDWMHKHICNLATRIIGVDIDGDAIQEITERGYKVLLADVETVRLDEKFQIVFAGKLIEHLDNFHAMLETARTHLDKAGTLILTTPNVFCFTNFIYRLGKGVKVNKEHTCWFCETTIRQLLERNGFQVSEIKYIPHETPSLLRRIVSKPFRLLLPDQLAWGTIMVVAKLR